MLNLNADQVIMESFNTDVCKFMWTRDEAVQLIKDCWNACAIHGYHIALTGSVLYHGVSDNDLDLILYPRITPHDDYRNALEIVAHTFKSAKMHVIKWDNEEHKLVFDITTIDGRKVNVMVPNFTLKGCLNTNIEIISNKGKGKSA
jgi:hypothetical protein